MSVENYAVVRCSPLRMALDAPTNSLGFTTLEPSFTEPVGNGIFPVGLNNAYGPRRIEVIPVGNGNPGDTFSMRVWGWQTLGSDPATMIWWPTPLVELACAVCALPAPRYTPDGQVRNPPPVRLMQETDKVCDTISVTNGSLGPMGELVAWGGNLMAFVMCETRGVQKIQFDFQADSNQYVNAMWSTA